MAFDPAKHPHGDHGHWASVASGDHAAKKAATKRIRASESGPTAVPGDATSLKPIEHNGETIYAADPRHPAHGLYKQQEADRKAATDAHSKALAAYEAEHGAANRKRKSEAAKRAAATRKAKREGGVPDNVNMNSEHNQMAMLMGAARPKKRR